MYLKSPVTLRNVVKRLLCLLLFSALSEPVFADFTCREVFSLGGVRYSAEWAEFDSATQETRTAENLISSQQLEKVTSRDFRGVIAATMRLAETGGYAFKPLEFYTSSRENAEPQAWSYSNIIYLGPNAQKMPTELLYENLINGFTHAKITRMKNVNLEKVITYFPGEVSRLAHQRVYSFMDNPIDFQAVVKFDRTYAELDNLYLTKVQRFDELEARAAVLQALIKYSDRFSEQLRLGFKPNPRIAELEQEIEALRYEQMDLISAVMPLLISLAEHPSFKITVIESEKIELIVYTSKGPVDFRLQFSGIQGASFKTQSELKEVVRHLLIQRWQNL